VLQITKIDIINFVVFDHIEIKPSVCPKKPLTVVRAENASGKTTLLPAIRWGLWGEGGLPGAIPSDFPLHPAEWVPDTEGVETKVEIHFQVDGLGRHCSQGGKNYIKYQLRRKVLTVAKVQSSPDSLNFSRKPEATSLYRVQPDGSLESDSEGVDLIIDELWPKRLQDFFVMDADEAADFVGGVEAKPMKKSDVIEKTSLAVRSLLGLEIFEKTIKRLEKISHEFERKLSKESGDDELIEQQAELDRTRRQIEDIDDRLQKSHNAMNENRCSLKRKKDQYEAELRNHGAYPQLQKRREDIEKQLKQRHEQRRSATINLSSMVTSPELYSLLAVREILHVRNLLKPLHDDGSIPIHHLQFVRGLLDEGICVCGQDLKEPSCHRRSVEHVISQSEKKELNANYLAQVYDATNELIPGRDDNIWERRCQEGENSLRRLNDEINDLTQAKRSIDRDLNSINEAKITNIRNRISVLEDQSNSTAQEIRKDEDERKSLEEQMHRLVGAVHAAHRSVAQARDYKSSLKIANMLIEILSSAYARIRKDQVEELSTKMNALFQRMAANADDCEDVDNSTIRMIAKIGLHTINEAKGDYEIYALNREGKSMPPTEINGASRRILALSFVLALCNVSNTSAPLIADSLLNFTSGSVRTNTLRIAAETASQPILLLTGSDLEAQSEVDLVERYAGATYTLTAQFGHGGDVINQVDQRRVSLICECGPRQFCDVCERRGQAGQVGWEKRQWRGNYDE